MKNEEYGRNLLLLIKLTLKMKTLECASSASARLIAVTLATESASF